MKKNVQHVLIMSCIMLSFVVLGQEHETYTEKEINKGWRFKQVNGAFTGLATTPGTIHTDLLANKFIEDPFYRLNEQSQQWIDKEDWEYETTFLISEKEFSKTNLMLLFKGLDTYACKTSDCLKSFNNFVNNSTANY